MLSRLLPKQIDNDYRGYRFAIWLLGAILLLRLGMSYGALFDTRDMMRDADSIPLDSFGAAGADTVVYVTRLVGLDHLLLNVVGIVALIRWRSMLPFVYLLLTIEQVARKTISLLNPIPRTGANPLPLDPNLVIIVALLIGLGLSLAKASPRGGAPASAG